MVAERAGEKAKAITSFQYAAEQGFPAAQWKLGRMYADGDGVKQSDLRAFEYFSRIADTHPEASPGTPQARFVASAFVALGHYYLEGIPDTQVRRDVAVARRMYNYAASYFGDPDGQYHLARLYIDGVGVPKQPRLAGQWLTLAARKGQYQAQAVLGHMLFKGEDVPRQAAVGLMWLTLARDAASPGEGWISEMYEAAFKQATADERAQAGEYLMRWMNGRRN
jgi:TPR repeat protein